MEGRMAIATLPYDDYRIVRMMAIVKSAFLVGFAIGGYRGGRRASLQFMAETQHALGGIRTRREAAAYWKSRHARTIVGATKEGIVRSLQLTAVAMVFVTVRQLVDHLTSWVTERRVNLAKPNEHNDDAYWTTLKSSNLVTKFCPYTGQVAAAATAGSLLALVAPNSQRLRYGLRGAAMGGIMALSLSVLQYMLSSISVIE